MQRYTSGSPKGKNIHRSLESLHSISTTSLRQFSIAIDALPYYERKSSDFPEIILNDVTGLYCTVRKPTIRSRTESTSQSRRASARRPSSRRPTTQRASVLPHESEPNKPGTKNVSDFSVGTDFSGSTVTTGTPFSPLVDHKLENWTRWMEIRKNFHKKVKERLNRKPKDMVMNQSELFREKIEDVTKIRYAQIAKPDKQRGCPSFWKLPVELKREGRPSLFGTINKEDKCKVPSMEFIGAPGFILKEKGIESSEE